MIKDKACREYLHALVVLCRPHARTSEAVCSQGPLMIVHVCVSNENVENVERAVEFNHLHAFFVHFL